MKARDFLNLVDRTLTAQQNYFAARRKGVGVITERELLIKSKDLEKQCRAVIAEGRLEPDDLPPATLRLSESEYAEYMRLVNQHQIELQLDLENQYPVEGKGDTKQ